MLMILPKHIHTWKHNSAVNDITIEEIFKIKPKKVYDIGAGDGFYGKVLKHLFDNIYVIGIEKNPIYIKEFNLGNIYDEIINGDIIRLISEIYGDLIIFGDVLEHLEKQDMIDVLEIAVNNFEYVIVNSPLGFQPQSHKYEEEIHRCGLCKEDFEKYEILIFEVYDEIMFNCFIKGNYVEGEMDD